MRCPSVVKSNIGLSLGSILPSCSWVRAKQFWLTEFPRVEYARKGNRKGFSIYYYRGFAAVGLSGGPSKGLFGVKGTQPAPDSDLKTPESDRTRNNSGQGSAICSYAMKTLATSRQSANSSRSLSHRAPFQRNRGAMPCIQRSFCSGHSTDIQHYRKCSSHP
jgi:hypothetical protein